jgi:hypothetical protein
MAAEPPGSNGSWDRITDTGYKSNAGARLPTPPQTTARKELVTTAVVTGGLFAVLLAVRSASNTTSTEDTPAEGPHIHDDPAAVGRVAL